MKRFFRIFSLLLLPLLLTLNLSGCASSFDLSDGMKQYSTYSLLKKGYIQGNVTFNDLKGYSDFGIGATSGINGSITVNRNKGYVNTSGKSLQSISRNQTISFGVFTKFDTGRSYSLLNQRSRQDVEDYIDGKIPTNNHYYAIRIQGEFQRIVLRNYSAKASSERSVYISDESGKHVIKDISGTLIGYRFPSHLESSRPFHYHFHFISNQQKMGGHVEGFRFGEGTITIDQKNNLNIRLPNTSAFKKSQFN